MINPGYNLSAKDYLALEDLRRSHVYGSYLKSIAYSPAFKTIMKIHIENVDIKDDITRLKQQGQLPEGISGDALNGLFKQSLGAMAMGIVADTILLKELENVNIDEVILGLKKDSDISYLLGTADKKFYEKAADLLDKGKINESTLEYRGLMAYLRTHKLNKKEKTDVKSTLLPTQNEPMKLKNKVKLKAETKIEPDLSSNNIRI